MSQPATPQTSTSAFLHSLGHSRRFRDVSYESALPTRTDIVGRTGRIGKVPTVEVAVAAYSIAGAARRGGASLWKSCLVETVGIDLR